MRHWFCVAFLTLPSIALGQFLPERLQLLTSGRYAELEVLGEREVGADPKPNSARLMPLCTAYAKLKRYNKVFPCLDRLEANVRAGDIAMQDMEEMQRNNPVLSGLARFGMVFAGGEEGLKGTVVPTLHALRCEVYTELREYDKAIAAGKEAVRSVPTTWNMERFFRIQALSALGLAQALSGDRDAALKSVSELEAIGTSYPHGSMKQPKWAGAIRIRVALGDFKRAHEIFVEEDPQSHGAFMSFAYAVGGAVAGMGANRSLTAWTDLPLAFLNYKVRLEVGEVKEAKAGFDRLLAVPEVQDNGEVYWLLLYDRGRIAAAEGDLAGALEFWKRAVAVIESHRSTINTEANKIGFVGDKQAVYRGLVAGLVDLGRHAEAFDYVERSKARALVDLLAGKKDFSVAAPDVDAIRKLLESTEQAETDALAQVMEAAGEPVRQRTLKVADTRRALQDQAPELASLVSVTSAPIAEIQKRIPEDEALVEYYYDDRAVYAFVVTQSGIQVAKLAVEGLEGDVRQLRELIENPTHNDFEVPAKALYSRLVRPLEAAIRGKKLLIVAHGVLHYLPFAALHDGTAFLLDRHAMRFLPSASVIRYLRTAPAAERLGVLAFGNPDLGDPKLDLQFAQEEALEIVKKVPQSRALLRKEATEAAFRQYAAGFSILHFATHGEFRSDAPLNSALMLAKDGDSDGLLTVSKLYSVRIAADLVTLSACETGLGKVASGDDVVGLTRGFLYAGASTVVASLWKVDDRGTSALMTRFYDELKGGDRREALRRAQLAAREQFPHPFFWTAFQLTGRAD
ncbi:MAG TPA: CHAT domain-containing protein [Burkholderiales bacterium]|nr:CHAT domain-containing protein [Burkholderiales bacterium]